MANSDFYLNFGSNADPFAKDLASELGPGIEKITALTEAIIRYDETVGDLSSSNPLGGLFSNLDNVSAKLESVGKDLSGTFGRITDSLGVLTRDLQSALEAVSRASGSARATTRAQPRVNSAGYTPEQQRIIDQQRRASSAPPPAATQVRDEEMTPARRQKSDDTISKITRDSDAARNAVKRVADINATLARNATDSADALKNLGQTIRGLTLQTKTSDRSITQGSLQPQAILLQQAPGGVLAPVDASQVQQAQANANVAAAATPAPIVNEPAPEPRPDRILTKERFQQPAEPGSYQIPGTKDRRSVSNRINPGETFEQYFAREQANAAELDRIRKQTLSQSRDRFIDPSLNKKDDAALRQRGVDIRQTIENIGRKNLDQLVGDDAIKRALASPTPGAVNSSQVRASVDALLAPQKALTKQQRDLVPEALQEFTAQQKDFAQLARESVTERLGEQPFETFQFAHEKDPKKRYTGAVGQTRDYRQQVTEYDERHSERGDTAYDPGAYRAQVEAAVAEAREAMDARDKGGRDFRDRQEERDAPRRNAQGFYEESFQYRDRDGSTYRTPRPVLGSREGEGYSLREGESPEDKLARENEEFRLQALAEARASRNAAQVADLHPEGSQPTPQADAKAVNQRINEAAQNLSSNLNERTEAEAQANEGTVQLSRAERNYARTLQRVTAMAEQAETDPSVLSTTQYAKANNKLSRQAGVIGPERAATIGELDEAELNRLIAAGGRKPPRPPTPPAPPAAAPEPDEPGSTPIPTTSRARVSGRVFERTADIEAFEAKLQQVTRDILAAEKAALPNLTGIQRTNSIERGARALAADPAFAELQSLPSQRNTLGALLGLQRGASSYGPLQTVYGRGGSGTAQIGLGGGDKSEEPVPSDAAEKAQQTQQALSRYNETVARSAGLSANSQRALLAEFSAQERYDQVLNASVLDVAKLADAKRALIAATEASAAAQEKENPSLQTKLFGTQGFGQSQLRHIGLGLENTIGYTLVFEGLDQLKELVHDGLEAQAAFARLQASLTANGLAAGNLRQQFQNISAETATPLEQVTEAASELSGTLQSTSDIAFGAKVASQLANISQGTLNATSAAVALRDVVAAYGDTWASTGISVHQGIQQTGDDIAHLSQLTGVNVKDIAEGTSEVASEARDFGLNQRQASTIAAYVTQGTGQTGEQAASQTTRLISGLYNTKTQEALQRILTPRQGGPSINQQFQSGDIGGVLTELIKQYGTLNDANKQYIASLIGTGITARAFAALIGGGDNAVKALNGDFSDFGALQQQNQTYLETISGRIKQLKEDFENFGSTLQQLGAFDFLGVFAESLDLVFKAANKLFGFLTNFANTNFFGLPTGEALHLTTTLLEAAAAYKLIGGFVVGKTLGTSLGARLLGGLQPSNAAAIASARAAGIAEEELPAARYAFRDVAAAAGGSAVGGIRGVGGRAAAGTRAFFSDPAREAEQKIIVDDTTKLAAFGRAVVSATGALEGQAEAAGVASTATEGQAAAATSAAAIQTGAAETAAASQLFLPGTAALAGQQLSLFGGGASALAEEGAATAAATEGQLALPLAFRSPTTGRFVSQSAAAERDLAATTQGSLFTEEELAAAQAGGGLPNVLPVGGKLGRFARIRQGIGFGAGRVGSRLASTFGPGTEEAIAANSAKVGVLGETLGLDTAVAGATGFSAAAGGALASPLLGVAGAIGAGLYGYNQLQAGAADAKSQAAAEQQLFQGSTNYQAFEATQNRTGAAGFRDYYFGHSTSVLGEIGHGAQHTGEAILDGGTSFLTGGRFGTHLGEGGGGPSDESNDRYFRLFDRITGGFSPGSAGDRVAKGRGYKDQLPSLGTAEAVQKYEEQANALIDKERDAIQKAGGNDKQAQAQIAFNINQLKANLQDAAQHRVAALEGLSGIDVLNSQQIGDLNNALGTISQLSPETLAQNPDAIKQLLQSGTLNPRSTAYRELQRAAGIVPQGRDTSRAFVTGYNEQGDYGYYDKQGQFYDTLNQVNDRPGPAPGQTAPRITSPLSAAAQEPTTDILFRNQQGVIGSYNLQGQFQAANTAKLNQLSAPEIQSINNTPAPPRPVNALTLNPVTLQKAQRAAAEQGLKSANAILATIGTPNAKSDAAVQQALQQQAQDLQTINSLNASIPQIPVQQAAAKASFATTFSGAAGGAAGLGLPTGTDAAVAATNQEVTALEAYGKTLNRSSPEFYQNLQAIAAAKQSIAQLEAAPELARLGVQEASTSDASQKAAIQAQIAQRQLQADLAGGATVQQIGQDRAAVASAGIAQQQASQAVTSAGFQLQIAQNRNSVTKAQLQLNQALQAEAVYRQGGLADQASLLNAEAQEAQARQAIADAVEAQREGAEDARAALAKYRGNDVAAATDELAKAQQAYAYAVQQYGRQSVQATQAYTALLSARTDVNQAVTAQITSGLDLEIAELNARGKSGDAQRAANVSLQKARVELNRYLKEGGKKGTATYNSLYSQVITAQRTAFDTALQAQLDTLDFQQQTYQITSAQEIASLQRILKNKQLTLQEQRNITLKIKGLQDNIREELTGAGLNIPSNITLPTAYDVRRSLGAGFRGSRTTTQGTVVNNNQQASVTVNQTLPSAAVAKAVANQVIDIINRQTGQQTRASSARPRTVAAG